MFQPKFNNKLLNQIEKNEIFYLICSNFCDIGFKPFNSNNAAFFLIKRRFFNFFLFTTNTKSINVKLKMNRFDFKYGNNFGHLTGFYRAVW